MSGYPEFAAGREELLRQGRRLLQKPYTLRNLAHAVRETLETNSVPELSSQ